MGVRLGIGDGPNEGNVCALSAALPSKTRSVNQAAAGCNNGFVIIVLSCLKNAPDDAVADRIAHLKFSLSMPPDIAPIPTRQHKNALPAIIFFPPASVDKVV